MSGPDAADHVRVINSVRFELESAGNPAYVVVIVDGAGAAQVFPMVYATVGPAADHAARLAAESAPDERVCIVSRSAADRRAMFTVVEPRSLKKLHQRLEVVEEPFADRDQGV